MSIMNIINTRKSLEQELQIALSTMEKKETIKQIREKIYQNQNKCPHFDSQYDLTWINDTCPYCGKQHCIKPEGGL